MNQKGEIMKNTGSLSKELLISLLMITAFSALVLAAGIENAQTAETGLMVTFIGIFSIGLALNLTPCVYPMLTITISILGKDTGNSAGKAFIRALVYVGGMATMYSSLGVAAALTGSLFGGILQSPAMLIFIGLVFLILSLSMFGLFELQPPSFILNKIGNRSNSGLIGLFISGLFVGVFAAPCVGPPVIGLLTMVGHSGDPLYGFAVFFALSAGLGLPYIILGTFSGLLTKMPRSGAWMVWIKKLMGFALAGAGLFYISLGLEASLALPVIAVTVLIGGIYLGFLEKSNTLPAFTMFKRMVGLALIAVSIMLLMQNNQESATWELYSTDSVQTVDSKPSILYFSASWCIPCLELDRRTLTDPSVKKTMNHFRRFKVDLSQYESPDSKQLREKYEIKGVPTLIFLDSDGREIRSERHIGFIGVPEMMSKLEKTLKGGARVSEQEIMTAEEAPSEPSKISMVTDVEAIVPGQPFKLGILFEMKPDWYVYWKNPGDSGTEPQIEWKLPAGFSAGDLYWPAPTKFSTPPFATFGHKNKALLFVEVTPPSDLQGAETIKFSADVSWLVCKEICVGQDASVVLELPVSGRGNTHSVSSDVMAEFRRTASEQPADSPEWTFKADSNGKVFTLSLYPPSEIDEGIIMSSRFFPLQQGLVRSDSIVLSRADEKYLVTMTGTGLKPDKTLGGIFILPDSYTQGSRFIKVNADYEEKD